MARYIKISLIAILVVYGLIMAQTDISHHDSSLSNPPVITLLLQLPFWLRLLLYLAIETYMLYLFYAGMGLCAEAANSEAIPSFIVVIFGILGSIFWAYLADPVWRLFFYNGDRIGGALVIIRLHAVIYFFMAIIRETLSDRNYFTRWLKR